MNSLSNPGLVHLGIAEIIVTDSPLVISTILGSCISVCVYSVKGTVGGINHFALPHNPEIGALEEEPFRYGDKSTRAMLKAILAMPGVQTRHLRAKVIGGACLMGEGTVNAAIGKQNAQMAQAILSEFKIAVTDVVVGGSNGCKIVFHTESGEVKITSVKNLSVPRKA